MNFYQRTFTALYESMDLQRALLTLQRTPEDSAALGVLALQVRRGALQLGDLPRPVIGRMIEQQFYLLLPGLIPASPTAEILRNFIAAGISPQDPMRVLSSEEARGLAALGPSACFRLCRQVSRLIVPLAHLAQQSQLPPFQYEEWASLANIIAARDVVALALQKDLAGTEATGEWESIVDQVRRRLTERNSPLGLSFGFGGTFQTIIAALNEKGHDVADDALGGNEPATLAEIDVRFAVEDNSEGHDHWGLIAIKTDAGSISVSATIPPSQLRFLPPALASLNIRSSLSAEGFDSVLHQLLAVIRGL